MLEIRGYQIVKHAFANIVTRTIFGRKGMRAAQKIATAANCDPNKKNARSFYRALARLEAAVTRAASIIQRAFSLPPLAAGFFIAGTAGAAIGGTRGNNLWSSSSARVRFPVRRNCAVTLCARKGVRRPCSDVPLHHK